MSDQGNSNNQVSAARTPNLPMSWGTSTVGLENRRKASLNINTKHGLFSSVPILCRGRSCPYFETCWIPEADLQVGERCPIEIGAIVERFDRYCNALAIDPEDPNDIVDAGIVKEIVDIEIMMMRADGLLAVSGNFIEQVVSIVSPKGQEYYKPELHKALELKTDLRKEKTRLLNQLNATRKDKKDSGAHANDPSSVAARIIAKVKDLEKQGKIIDVTPDDAVSDNNEEVKEDASRS